MFCMSCDKEDIKLDLKNPTCKSCGFDNSYVLKLIVEEDDDEDLEEEFRSPLACAQRSIILFAVVSAGYGEDRSKIIGWLKEERLWSYVSEEEKAFFESPKPTEQQIINATWRVEALSVLLWALQKIPSISNLRKLSDVKSIQDACSFYMRNTQDFLESAQLLSEDEIYDANEMIYDAHWKVRDAQINGRPVPEEIIPGLVQERHHAINWLMGYCGQEWDEVTTDT